MWGNTDADSRPKAETPLLLWCNAHGVSVFEVARGIRRDPKTLYRIAPNQQMPSLVLAFQLEKYSEGGIAVEQWLGTELGRLLWNTEGVDWEKFAAAQKAAKQRYEAKGRTKHAPG